jgi:glycosyltransferase involved in cell wall biosynthesis
MTRTVHLEYLADSGCPYNRQLLPARFCTPDLVSLGVHVSAGMLSPPGVDVMSIHGVPMPGAERRVARHKRLGGTFLWSLDDDHLSIPDWNPAVLGPDGLDSWWMAKHFADRILVSTPALAETLADVRERVLVAPNLIDPGEYPAPPGNPAVELPVRVVWSGSRTHRGDVEQVEPAIDALLRRFSRDELAVVWMGEPPPNTLVRDWLNRGLIYQPGVPFAAYHKTVAALRPDVYLCPLAEIPFNTCKSNLRVMEAWALGAVPVASAVGEYCCVRSGIDGRLVRDADGWFSAVSRLVSDHAYRFELAAAGRRRVAAEYNWTSAECRRPWVEAFKSASGITTTVV